MFVNKDLKIKNIINPNNYFKINTIYLVVVLLQCKDCNLVGILGRRGTEKNSYDEI